MTLFLQAEEIDQLTGKKRHRSQAYALTMMGIHHVLRPDGSLAVLRAHVDTVFGHSNAPIRRKTSPDFSMLQ